MTWSDSHLLNRLRANEHAAFELVVERHYQAVFQQLWHLCYDRDLAADLTQETFAQAWKSVEGFAGASSIRTWLYTIAVRVWYRWKNHPSNQLAHSPLDERAELVPDGAPCPAHQLEKSARRQDVARALQELPSPYRETMVLFYVQNLKYREVAQVLDISIGTVKSRLHEGLKRLKTALVEEPTNEIEIKQGGLSCGKKTLNII